MKSALSILLFLVAAIANAQPPGEWMWIKGSNIVNDPGSFGTQNVSSPTNNPPALYEACEWTDLAGNFWLFGGMLGTSNGLYSALWKYNVATNEWTWVKGPNSMNNAGSYGTQGVPSPANNPPSRGHGAATWVDLQGNFWLFGGTSIGGGGYCDLWMYDISTNEWTWMKGPATVSNPGIYGSQGVPNINNYPAGRYEIASSWTDNDGDLWLFGGLRTSPSTANYNDLWRFNISTNTWTWMKGSSTVNQPGVYGTMGMENSLNTPGARNAYCHWKDNQGNLWFFGGEYASNLDFYNDMWRYNPVTNNWTWMGGSNLPNASGHYGTKCLENSTNIPGRRYESRAAWTDKYGNFWLFGGGFGLYTNVTVYNDLWFYCVTSNEWTWVSGDSTFNPPGNWGTIGVPNSSNKPNGRHASVSWTDNNRHLYFFGGSGTVYSQSYGDLWIYDIDDECTRHCDSISMSVTDEAQEFLLKLYPNPTNSSFTIESNFNNLLEKITLLTTDRRIVISISNLHSATYTLNISELSAGIYVLDCESEKGHERVKVVKY